MNIVDAIKQLQDVQAAEGDKVTLMVYIQTGADSWEWRAISGLSFGPLAGRGIIVDVEYK